MSSECLGRYKECQHNYRFHLAASVVSGVGSLISLISSSVISYASNQGSSVNIENVNISPYLSSGLIFIGAASIIASAKLLNVASSFKKQLKSLERFL